jgi:glycosyltransferase involved in cell wall biosynthesis
MTKSSETVFFSVVYPEAEKFLEEFFDSLSKQTVKNFDVYIINDQLENFEAIRRKFDGLKIIESEYHDSPAKIREFGLKMMANMGYENIIFGDADDGFAENRVEYACELLSSNDVVVNDLNLIDAESNMMEIGYLSRRLRNGEIIERDFIKEKNVFGFSNSAVRAWLLNDTISFHNDLEAVDWYYFDVLLRKAKRAVFTSGTYTCYRRHGNNCAAIQHIDDAQIVYGVKVKATHYDLLSSTSDEYSLLHEQYRQLMNRLDKDADFKVKYLQAVKKNNPQNAFWWEAIKLPEEVGL